MSAEAQAACYGCGRTLERVHGTAYKACCSRLYWLRLRPLPRDGEGAYATFEGKAYWIYCPPA